MKAGIVSVISFWLFVVSISCWWNVYDELRESKRLAFETARAFFKQVVIARTWNASLGGVYAPISNDLQPNLYLEDPLRDLMTDTGISLTKINPAYMTRQMAEIASLESGIKFHITSLRPIRPANKPTDWEEMWLKTFEQGAAEQGDFFREGGTSFFRYMAPLKVEQNCLKCHAKQGYKIDDIRGGISVTIPYLAEEKNTILIASYALTAGVGCALILIGGILLAKRREELLHSNDTLQQGIVEREQLISDLKEANSRIKTLCGIVPICMYCKGIRDDKGYWNQLEKFISEHSTARFSHGICPKCLKEKHPSLNQDEG